MIKPATQITLGYPGVKPGMLTISFLVWEKEVVVCRKKFDWKLPDIVV